MKDLMTWEKITDILIKEFENQNYKKDEKMPSENNMAIRFCVARTEIRRAYEQLKDMGYIYSIQGCGSFFSGKKEKIKLIISDNQSFTEKMKALGVSYETKNMGCEEVKDHAALGEMGRAVRDFSKQEKVYKLSRLRMIDGEPAAIHISYLSGRVFPNLSKDGRKITSLFSYMKEWGYDDFQNKDYQLSVIAPDQKERKMLQMKGYNSCLVLNAKCIENESGRILEISRTIYRGDRFIFVL